MAISIMAGFVVILELLSGGTAFAAGQATRIYFYEDCLDYGVQVRCGDETFARTGNAVMRDFDFLERLNLLNSISAAVGFKTGGVASVRCRNITDNTKESVVECSNGGEFRLSKSESLEDAETEAAFYLPRAQVHKYDFSTVTNIQKLSDEVLPRGEEETPAGR